MPANIINDYTCEKPCEYKGRNYLVRDNGAICRLPKEDSKPSKWDNVWTFGAKNANGYMVISGNIRVHQVVCTAFHGPEPKPHMVVDHIDTNRCNNRPENLRWLTRLENALNNDATRKRIIYLCGSIEAFIENPSILNTMKLTNDISWMRTVTKEEAAACLQHIEEWSKRNNDNTQKSDKGIGEWIYNPPYKSWKQRKAEIEELNRIEHERQYGLKDSLTPGAKQLNWKTPTEFLLCPKGEQERTLQAYLDNLVKGKVFTRNQYKDGGVVLECGINEAENALIVLTQKGDEENDEIKPWALCKVTLQDGFFVHENQHSFFKKDGGQKYFTLAMGREWTGGNVFDDYCPS